MFSWLLALTLSILLSSAKAAPSFVDLRPSAAQKALPMAASKPVPVPIRKDAARLGVVTVSQASAVVDWRSGSLLFGKDEEKSLPIASITKLMTALVVLDEGTDQDKTVKILDSDYRPGGISYVMPGEEVTVAQLMHISLIASGNNATVALARATGLSVEDFASRMNSLARRIGMTNSAFVEPSGLDPGNVASARDVAALVRAAFSSPTVDDIVGTRNYSFTSKDGRPHIVSSTDELLGSFLTKPPYEFLGGKTGYLDEAGYCFTAAARDGRGNRLIAVVLGAPTKDERFSEVKSLLYWAFDAFDWPSSDIGP